MPSQPPVRTWSGRQRGNVLGHWIFQQLLKIAGRDAAGWLLFPVTAYYWLFSGAGRRASAGFLERLSRLGIRPPRLRVFTHLLAFADVLLDRACLFSGVGGKFAFTFDGEEHIRTALAAGRGVILVSAHMGNWEAAGSLLRARVSGNFSVAMVRAEANRLNAYLDKTQGSGLTVIALDDPDGSLQILAALRRGEAVAMHGDRFLPGARTRRLDFLGGTAAFPEGPFHLAALAGAPIITCFALRLGCRRYTFRAFPPETLAAGRAQRDQAVAQALKHYAARVEAVVREYPGQWFNFYNFWA
jgi:predicted LPLAT superfamily acyltransferase